MTSHEKTTAPPVAADSPAFADLRAIFSRVLRGKGVKVAERHMGVSVKSLDWLVQGQPVAPPARKAGTKADFGQKRFRAKAQQLAKAIRFVREVAPDEVRREPKLGNLEDMAEAFGLRSPTVEHQLSAIVDEVFRNERFELDRPSGFDGPIIEDARRNAAAARRDQSSDDGDGPEALFTLGAMAWDPIHCEVPQDGESLTRDLTFGVSVAQRLIRSLGPGWRIEDVVSITGFDTALDKLINQPLGCHLVVGLYETTPRFAAGVTFIRLPGLRAQAAVLAKCEDFPDDDKHKWAWPSILEPTLRPMPHQKSNGVLGIVLRDEASHTHLQGACLYGSPHRGIRTALKRIASTDPSDSEQIFRDAARALLEESKRADIVPYFCADAVSSIRVARHLLRLKAGRDAPVETLTLDLLKSAGFKFLRFDDSCTPTYAIGFAVRRDAGPLVDLLHRAMQDDLLGRNLTGLAHDYIKLADRAICPLQPSPIFENDPIKFSELVDPNPNEPHPHAYMPVFWRNNSDDHTSPESRIRERATQLLSGSLKDSLREPDGIAKWFSACPEPASSRIPE